MDLDLDEDCEIIGVAEIGQAALDLIPRLRLDIVVSDYVLTKMDGIETSHALQSLPPDIPTISLSIYNPKKLLRKAPGSSMFTHMEISPAQLKEAIQNSYHEKEAEKHG